VDYTLEAETKHTCWCGSYDDIIVDGETTVTIHRLVMGNMVILRETPSVINRLMLKLC
jgi:hypothetical protein